MKQLLLFFSLLVSFHIHAILVTGIVVNKETGECIEGVSILTLNSDSVVVSQDATQADGKFRINIPKVGDYVLRFSNITPYTFGCKVPYKQEASYKPST